MVWLTVTVMPISSTMNMSLFTFTIMAIAIRTFHNTSSAFSIMSMSMVSVICVRSLDINRQKNYRKNQKWKIRLHVDSVMSDTLLNWPRNWPLQFKVFLDIKVQCLTLKNIRKSLADIVHLQLIKHDTTKQFCCLVYT